MRASRDPCSVRQRSAGNDPCAHRRLCDARQLLASKASGCSVCVCGGLGGGLGALFQNSGAGESALIGVLGSKVQLAPGHLHYFGAATVKISTAEVSMVTRAVLDFCLPGREVGEQGCAPLRVRADSEHAIAAIDRKQRRWPMLVLFSAAEWWRTCSLVAGACPSPHRDPWEPVRRSRRRCGKERPSHLWDRAFDSADILAMRETATEGQQKAGISISGRRAELCSIFYDESLSIVGFAACHVGDQYYMNGGCECWVAKWMKPCSCSVRVLVRQAWTPQSGVYCQ